MSGDTVCVSSIFCGMYTKNSLYKIPPSAYNYSPVLLHHGVTTSHLTENGVHVDTHVVFYYLLTLIGCSSSLSAMEYHSKYMLNVPGENAKVYQQLAELFSEGETPSLDALSRWIQKTSHPTTNIPETFSLIRELLKKHVGKEQIVPDEKGNIKVILLFDPPVPAALFESPLLKEYVVQKDKKTSLSHASYSNPPPSNEWRHHDPRIPPLVLP